MSSFQAMQQKESLQKRIQHEVEQYQKTQKDYQKYIGGRQQLDAQLNENIQVKEELDRLEAAANVYKMIGPVLVKQDLHEAKQNVQKRIDYINGELKRHDGLIQNLEKKQEEQREILANLQKNYQQAQQAQAKINSR
ncbi:hypothetical protein CHS0354_020408 [Potamilus streckersoni]|uniref:Prefoldin subunit 6 n=1 Tax=Potamilus streckersoni TaxID=2493646 RepID=A0AAE0TFN4_9BIVA|nr:hypothetical protein CHS0354_020408 [Potamilus streckersoni]